MSENKHPTENLGSIEREIGYYNGVLSVKEECGKYFWSIEDWDCHALVEWDEIPKSLYDELVRYGDWKAKSGKLYGKPSR